MRNISCQFFLLFSFQTRYTGQSLVYPLWWIQIKRASRGYNVCLCPFPKHYRRRCVDIVVHPWGSLNFLLKHSYHCVKSEIYAVVRPCRKATLVSRSLYPHWWGDPSTFHCGDHQTPRQRFWPPCWCTGSSVWNRVQCSRNWTPCNLTASFLCFCL